MKRLPVGLGLSNGLVRREVNPSACCSYPDRALAHRLCRAGTGSACSPRVSARRPCRLRVLYGSASFHSCQKGCAVEHLLKRAIRATPMGFEPTISTVTGWHVRPLHHGATKPDRAARHL